ncbi:MAG TPA: pyridoxal phosphate-dependent aminotransferase [Acidobacteriaceae bacterium]|jgi:aspartate/methionine/tyrosine aminotransferase|nr:pyridoxal phosphate-dependent aminotransferase [Acidobacteriaceae bacterium]
MTFSTRTAWELTENALTQRLRERRERGGEVLDLTVSNPTACGFRYDANDLLSPLSQPAALIYDPQPFGLASARAAVAEYYRDHNADIPIENICLTTSTSEAYSYLFRLLCDPGDEILIARPSYPLFAFIAQLDSVRLREYPLQYDPGASHTSPHAWTIDLDALRASITPRTRALIVVHPNNPTGNYASAAEREALESLCTEHSLALIVDEVFLDYPISPSTHPHTFAAANSSALTFVLSGISKVCALPQMKLSWIVIPPAASGPNPLLQQALARLEVIADTFLSVNAPTQAALPHWLAHRSTIQNQIRERVVRNLAALDRRLHNSRSSTAQRLALEAGWTAVLRVPRTIEGQPFAEAALDHGVLLQPGEFYGLPEGRAVLSLLTPPESFDAGLKHLPID